MQNGKICLPIFFFSPSFLCCTLDENVLIKVQNTCSDLLTLRNGARTLNVGGHTHGVGGQKGRGRASSALFQLDGLFAHRSVWITSKCWLWRESYCLFNNCFPDWNFSFFFFFTVAWRTVKGQQVWKTISAAPLKLTTLVHKIKRTNANKYCGFLTPGCDESCDLPCLNKPEGKGSEK